MRIKDLPVPQGIQILDDANITLAVVERPLTEEELKKLDESAGEVDLTKIEVEKKGKEVVAEGAEGGETVEENAGAGKEKDKKA
jgi:hypothetical protein